MNNKGRPEGSHNSTNVKKLKEYFEKLDALTKEFKSITKYSDKLNFWITNELSPYSLSHSFRIPELRESIDEGEQIDEKFRISIFPKTIEERDEFLKWRVEYERKKLIEDFNKRIERFSTTIQRTDFINKEIESHQKLISKKNEVTNTLLTDLKHSYDLTASGKNVELPLLPGNWNNTIKGIAYYYHNYFLIEEKDNLLKNNEPLVANRLTHKQQILLLENLGILNLQNITRLSIEQKGIVIGALLNKDSKNTSDYIRYLGGVKKEPKFICTTDKNINTVNQLLTECGFNSEELIKLNLSKTL